MVVPVSCIVTAFGISCPLVHIFLPFSSVEIILLSQRSGIYEGDPLSPPEGEAAQGGRPP
jgi:hypothetical protein